MIATIVQIVGLAAVAIGVGLACVWAGIVVGGVEIVALGVALELRSQRAG